MISSGLGAHEAHDAHMKMSAWENCRKENESIDDENKRFYRLLPKAAGGIRLLQLGCAKLMGEFDALCRENGLQYCASYDAIRRCSPWCPGWGPGSPNSLERLRG